MVVAALWIPLRTYVTYAHILCPHNAVFSGMQKKKEKKKWLRRHPYIGQARR